MEDVKESVRQGVTKVAGRLSNMASGVMNQLQVRKSINIRVTRLLLNHRFRIATDIERAFLPFCIQYVRFLYVTVCFIVHFMISAI